MDLGFDEADMVAAGGLEPSKGVSRMRPDRVLTIDVKERGNERP